MVKSNILICKVCLSRNYRVKVHNRNQKLVLNKYCCYCKKHIIHEETR
ncbi:MAG: 50S ribosomal protein L33 [Sweet potato little leaf phytoplasma]|nr:MULTISPECIES: 50S ribosomal protein L33 [Phytoplasma]MCG3566590.1 50S ribosomal protein L33 [Sesame phyllody phytoplasma]MDO8030968.1 50S ribosomal protein L33 [Candidatus Phytoplasma australasiaticum]MDO8052759.1 50S ribosomal protein L33 ['Vigna radiata' phytoplasma]MDO8054897.1 50S ribosomal protein L33 ['Cleome sp.' phytoplasma]MDO7986945.1 50S ribosomal protein L33 [Sweet potato little leaf phytoplasma]